MVTEERREYLQQFHGRRLVFKGKRLILPENPRTGVCSMCNRTTASGVIKLTQMHHIEYDSENPLAHTVELCVACHIFMHRGEPRKQRPHEVSVETGRRGGSLGGKATARKHGPDHYREMQRRGMITVRQNKAIREAAMK